MKYGLCSGVHLNVLSAGLLAGISLVATSAAADILFVGGAGADLSESTNWEGGACPGASDVAVIPVGAAAKTVTMSQPWSVGGIRLTDNRETLTIESTGAALTVGADGIVVEAGNKAADKGLALKVPVVINAEQTWDIGERLLETHGTISGTDTLTICNAFGVEHYAAPEYDGTIAYSMQMIDWISVPVRLHAKGRWAKKVTTPSRDFVKMCNLGLAVPAGECWNMGDIFTAESVYTSTNDDVGFQLVADAGTVVFAAADEQTVPKSGYRMETSVGTFELTGGAFSAWNYFRLLNGSTVRVTGGAFNASDSGKVCIAGGDGDDVQDPSERSFEQVGGEVNAYGLAVGGDRSDWTGVTPFGEYTLGAGILNARQSYGWNSHGGGLILSAKMTTGTDVSAPGVFTQTGGVANVDFVRFGCDNVVDANYGNMDGYGMIRLLGGTFNLGADGFKTGDSWNWNLAGSDEANSAYRLTLSGGTFSPDMAVLGLQTDFPPSATPVTVAPKRDMLWSGPVWGEGTLRKTGSAKLTLADAGRFSGTLDVAEGEVVIQPKADDPDADVCARWTGDSARQYHDAVGQPVTLPDGSEVSEWHEVNNGGRRVATRVTYEPKEGTFLPAGPTLVENAFGSHAGLRFYGNALEIPAADNPVAGQAEWSVVLVFKSDRQYWGAEWNGSSSMWRYLPGVIGNATVGWQNNDWGISIGSGSIYHLGVSYQDYDAPEGYDGYQPVGATGASLNDGKPHVLVCTQKGIVTTINADGALTSTNAAARAEATYPRQNLPCYIGFNSDSTRDKTAAPDWAGNPRTAQENFTDAAFQGVIAEIRLYDRALSADEQNALIKTLSVTYAAETSDETASGVAAPEPTLEFDADTLTGEDGVEVGYWASVDGSKGVSRDAGGWNNNTAPKLTKGTFAGHNAVRFTAAQKTALGLPSTDIPWLGKKNFAVAVAFRTTTDGLDRDAGDAGAEIKGRGLLSTAGMNNNSCNSLLLAFREKGAVSGGYLTTDAPWNWYQAQIVNVRKPCYLNDAAVHVAVMTYDETEAKLKLMVDGYFRESSYAATQVQNSDQNLFVGSASPGCDRYFDGDISAIRLYNRALSRAEMKALTDEWAARYGFLPLTGKCGEALMTSGGGLSARRINVAAGAKLTGSFSLGEGARLTGVGTVDGKVTFGTGARLDFGQMPSVSAIYLTDGAVIEVTESMLAQPADGSHIAKMSGEITFDFTAVADRLPPVSRLPLIGALAPMVLTEGVTFRIVGLEGEGKSVDYDANRRSIMFRQKHGMLFILK